MLDLAPPTPHTPSTHRHTHAHTQDVVGLYRSSLNHFQLWPPKRKREKGRPQETMMDMPDTRCVYQSVRMCVCVWVKSHTVCLSDSSTSCSWTELFGFFGIFYFSLQTFRCSAKGREKVFIEKIIQAGGRAYTTTHIHTHTHPVSSQRMSSPWGSCLTLAMTFQPQHCEPGCEGP